MPCIKPVSDLRNYNEVLQYVAEGEPVYLTKNGRGAFAVVTIEDYEKLSSAMKERQYIEAKLDEADKMAETTTKRYSHEEIFGSLREKLRK
jgi:prevent-host-death family protein